MSQDDVAQYMEVIKAVALKEKIERMKSEKK